MFVDFLEFKIMNEFRKQGNSCPFWPDEQILRDLKELDACDTGNRVFRYLQQCHCVHLRYVVDGKIEIYCRRNNIMLGDCFGSECKFQILEVQEKMKDLFPDIGK